jgi:hypothetical protein
MTTTNENKPSETELTPNAPAVEAPRAHHPFSPSTLQNREVCPCYESKQSAVLHERTIAGTKAHDAIEEEEDDNELSDEDAVAAAECLDFVDSRRRLMEATHLEQLRALQAAAPDATTLVFTEVEELKELYLPIDDEKFEDGATSTTAGYFDRLLMSPDRKYVEAFDWKFGKWEVTEAKDNLQGWAYVLGIFRKWPTVEKVRFFFKQPHLDLLSDAIFDRSQIPDMYLRIQVVVARARKGTSEAKAGNFEMARPHVPVCNFCANIGNCEKVLEFACRTGKKFHPLGLPDDISPTVVKDPANTKVAMDLVAVLKVWCAAFRRQVTDRILRGEAPLPEGQKIQEMQKRKVTSWELVKQIALKYMTPLEYEQTTESTFGALEKIISDSAMRGQKKAVVTQFKEELLSAGAVEMGDKFSFLKAVSTKSET